MQSGPSQKLHMAAEAAGLLAVQAELQYDHAVHVHGGLDAKMLNNVPHKQICENKACNRAGVACVTATVIIDFTSDSLLHPWQVSCCCLPHVLCCCTSCLSTRSVFSRSKAEIHTATPLILTVPTHQLCSTPSIRCDRLVPVSCLVSDAARCNS